MDLAILYRTATINEQCYEVIRAVFPVGKLTEVEREELQTIAQTKDHRLKFQRLLNKDDLKNMIFDL